MYKNNKTEGKKLINNISSEFLNSLVLAFAPLVFLYIYNNDKVFVVNITKTILFTLAVYLLLYKLFRYLIKDDDRRNLIMYLMIFLIFYSGNIWIFLKTIGLFRSGYYLSLGILFLVIFLAPALIFKYENKTFKISKKVNDFVDLFTKILLIIFSANIAFFYCKQIYFGYMKNSDFLVKENYSQASSSLTPNIYYIILDAYARNDVLKKYYNYDNGWFTNELQDLGFYVAKNSTSNYNQTYLSMTSSLNMNYLRIDRDHNVELGYQRLSNLINNNRAFTTLLPLEYSLKMNYSGWEALEKSDLKKSLTAFSEFEKIYLKTTIAKYILPKDFDHIVHDKKTKNSIKYILSNKPDDKVFMLAHVLSPHPPFIYDENGHLQPQDDNEFEFYDGDWKYLKGRSAEMYREKYVNQMKYLNKQILATLRELITKDPNAIIIVQGDHGPASYEEKLDPHPDIEYVERHSILNAYYFPDQSYENLYQDITPVNSFRIILRQYFNVDIDTIRDTNYNSPYRDPYNFKDVTEIVKK